MQCPIQFTPNDLSFEFSTAAVSSGYFVNYNYSYFCSYCPVWVMLICRSNPDLPLVQVRWEHTWGISAAWRKRLQLLYFYPPKLFNGLTLMCHRPWQWTTCGCVFGELAHLGAGRNVPPERSRALCQVVFCLERLNGAFLTAQLGPRTVLLGRSGFFAVVLLRGEKKNTGKLQD